MNQKLLRLAAALALSWPLAAQNPAVTVWADVGANRHAMNPAIYGVAYGSTATLLDLNAPLNRYGGNNTSRYNWQANGDNRGSDWYFESIGDSSSAGGVPYNILDNEPSIWHATHRDVHPTGATMDEVRQKIVDYADQIKLIDPGALVVGPEEWGWSGYFLSGYRHSPGEVMKPLLSLSSALLLAAASHAQTPKVGNCTVLPANNVWNTPVDTLPVAANSATYINTIGPSTGLHPDFGSGTWNGGPIGIPFVTVPGTQTKYPATFAYSDESDPGPYAVPLNAPIEGGSGSTGDRHAIAIDTDNCVLYELYAAYPQAASWQAGSGAIYNLNSNALRPAGWTSADAAGLPIMPGLVRYDEVASGQINHALRFTVPSTLRAYIWPARHYASSLTDPKYPPMGQRFRLKASFDISGYPAEVQVILRALKKYGMIIADNGSAWYISGEPDSRWNNDNLAKLRNVTGSAFEAVDESSLMVDANSGQARQPGPSVTVTPGSATVVTGATQQFAAAVQGFTDTSVTWSVNGILGGSSALGFVSATGLYTAPALVPSPATVSVQAATVATPAVTGSASVTIRNPAPAISSVTPNPLTTGSFKLTVNGSGFQSGTVVKLGGTALATTFVCAAQLTATGSTSATGTVAVTVVNPDGQTSAAFNIPVVGSISVGVSPAFATVRVGRTQRFTATVRNTTNTAVTWQVNGMAGGSSTVGTISAGGIYTAPPTVPSPASVTVRAVSVADNTKSATATVTIRR